MWRNFTSSALTFLLVLMFCAGGMLLWAKNQYSAEGPLEQAICLRVEQGSTMGRVSTSLAEQGAISSGYLFRVGVNYSDKAADLKAGSFLIPAGASMEGIVDLVTGDGRSTCGSEIVYRIGVLRSEVQLRDLDPETNRFEEKFSFDPNADEVPAGFTEAAESGDLRYRVALAEGATSWQVIEALKAADFLTGEVTEVPAEGTLAPDSYELRKGASRGELVEEMTRRQTAILDEAWQNRADGLPLETKEEALILASIVEKETGVAEERKQVASVFVNRLKQGMRLQTDPTVIYGVTEGKGALGRGLRQSELRRETPWNTYVIDGLPVTPIANPGRAAIEAALNPDDTEYLFFVADGTGGHAFAKTLSEHNDNVAKWRKIEAERNASE
ncbi:MULTISPECIES: endolytic transglycosylase MltG [Halocynthiibacter]|uniref:Endolytic murein transglycosylase n=1 Tax=Halocynthiibacter halioticoli TaxID=2986804 RepID=A0AAE3IXR5_9RHOB|nr:MULTISPECIES: endolytic transglycosylase MltG [Halocynthiibacter]MCV6824080.1 endolytic transglycosylase MltG [Halocynthiibacter halioticoli]MCW4057081.1 endolytic transglycosylase MltG [Halocynthiibacter sp. SDUM655004]